MKTLQLFFSNDRLAPYKLQPTDTYEDVLCRYLWNTALSEALYLSFSNFEVALRNSINHVTSKAFHPRWLDLPDGKILLPNEVDKVHKAKDDLKRRHKPMHGGHLVAALTLGFWTNLFNKPYDVHYCRKILSDKNFLKGIKTQDRKRYILSARFHKIQFLRNRVFHHEPIWHWADLEQYHRELQEAIYWISPEVSTYTKYMDKFPNIYKNGLAMCRNDIQALLKTP